MPAFLSAPIRCAYRAARHARKPFCLLNVIVTRLYPQTSIVLTQINALFVTANAPDFPPEHNAFVHNALQRPCRQ